MKTNDTMPIANVFLSARRNGKSTGDCNGKSAGIYNGNSFTVTWNGEESNKLEWGLNILGRDFYESEIAQLIRVVTNSGGKS